MNPHSWNLSATLAKSGPLDFPSEKRFLLFFAHEKGFGHMFQKTTGSREDRS